MGEGVLLLQKEVFLMVYVFPFTFAHLYYTKIIHFSNNSDTNIQVFPGDVAVVEEKGTDLRHYCHKLRNQKGVTTGVTVKVRLTDPVVSNSCSL